MMIEFQIPRSKTALQEIPTNKYIKRDENGMAYTIGGQPTFNDMQKNLMV